ncbi:MAG: helicase-exonuclease AddAB subunit AddA [Butyrivibrio sp.]|nr:helicase-exonuclease AddAB subunit AddA [Butyrivibrio sp.]
MMKRYPDIQRENLILTIKAHWSVSGMKVEFTKEQQAVIDARKCNVLVSAAAGSGKTAVLVERIIQMINEGMDIDHLLVVTFTKAAASQMKEKITLAIQEKLTEEPGNKHLQKQETLIHNAQITTIDSFCQYVIKNNFNFIGLDPSFRVGDEGEFKLLRDDVMSAMLENEYQKAKEGLNDDFLFCMDYFGTGSNDKNVEEYIEKLYRFSMSMPWPEDYLNERAHDYDIEDSDFDEISWIKECVSIVKRILGEASDKLGTAHDLTLLPDGPYMYGELLEKEAEAVAKLSSCDSYDQLFDAVRAISFDRLPSKKDDSVSPDKRDAAKNLRDSAKKDIKKVAEDYLMLPSDMVCEQMKLCDRAVKELCRLTLVYKQMFDEKKRDELLIDFSDMEHFALDILVDHETGEPTPVALEYRDFFKEVLIDEYQDSNNVQELILKSISGEEAGASERFMVGDVKQSIYKFRLARPEIFMDKLATYSKDAAASDRRIDLHKNFRSRKEVLEGTNYIFRKIMGRDLGSVEYDKDAELVTGADYPEPSFDMTPELIFIDDPKGEKENEAHAIGNRIHELMREDPELRFKDIVILLRSVAGWDDVFKKALEEQGIPSYIESKSGYFDAWEVSILLDVLSIIDNPTQDIPLVSVMHSPIGDFSDEELALLKIAIKESDEDFFEEPLYSGIKRILKDKEEKYESDRLEKKARAFVDFIEELRDMSAYTPVHELLQYIIDITGFELTVSAMPAGNQRRANIEQLLSRAESFEKTSFKGLFHFVRYIEHIKVVQVDYGEAGIIDENADVVRIMSIHKSKGLEFPVVFVAGLSKQFNRMDTKGDLIADMDLGIGVKCIDSKLRVKSETLKRVIVADKMNTDSLGEELRVLYVALTRAKEKLIMTASMKKLGDTLAKELSKQPELSHGVSHGVELLPYSMRLGASGYIDLILPSLIRHPAIKDIADKYELSELISDRYMDNGDDIPAISIKSVSVEDIISKIESESVKGLLRRDDITAYYDKELAERLEAKLSAKYGHEYLKGLFTKTTVTELKKHILEETGEHFTAEADYTKEGEAEYVEFSAGAEAGAVTGTGAASVGLTGAERGTAYHRAMELLDYSVGDSLDALKSYYEGLVQKDRMGRAAVDCLDLKDLQTFLGTDLGKRMGEAFKVGKLMREKPFMMGVPANELDNKFPADEMVLIQGIIDAWFFEGDDIVLMDYKTDHVRDESELIKRYKIQLDLYKRALEASTAKKVKEIYIYSFALGKEIRL